MSLVRITVEDPFDGLVETVLAVNNLTDEHGHTLIDALENAINEWRAAHPDYHEDFDPGIYCEEDEEELFPFRDPEPVSNPEWAFGDRTCQYCEAKATEVYGIKTQPDNPIFLCEPHYRAFAGGRNAYGHRTHRKDTIIPSETSDQKCFFCESPDDIAFVFQEWPSEFLCPKCVEIYEDAKRQHHIHYLDSVSCSTVHYPHLPKRLQ